MATINMPIAITAVSKARIRLSLAAEAHYLWRMNDLEDGPWRVVARVENAGLRLDRFLATRIGTISRSRVKSLIEAGHVAVSGNVATDPALSVRPGLEYVLCEPPSVAAKPVPQSMALPILFEDSDLLVLDKPAGLVVHPAPGNLDGTLVNALLAHCGDALPGIGGERRPGIVHRLDKDTSGVMVVAKSEMAMTALAAAFASRTLERSYLALCWGVPSPSKGEITGAIGRDPRERKRMAVVARGGKAALTRYRVQKTWEAVALVECRLATGRTHQIRVHLATMGHPLVGDPVYLRRIPAAARLLPPSRRSPLLDFPRQALHAAVLGFTHPRTHEALRFETPLPADFQSLLSALSDVETAQLP